MRAAAHMQETFMWSSRLDEEQKNNADDEQDGEGELTTLFANKEFQLMTLDEQLAFLVELPDHLPPLKCQFVMKDKSYEGILKKYTATELTIADERGNETVIGRAQLLAVTMIGFVQ
nr:CotO family spore coat protein [Geobacillus sp. BMUD]